MGKYTSSKRWLCIIYIYIYIYVCVCVCVYVCVRARACVCVRVFVCVLERALARTAENIKDWNFQIILTSLLTNHNTILHYIVLVKESLSIL